MINKAMVKTRFSKHAKTYDQYARVQKVMGDTLFQQICREKRTYQNILEIGCGTGYLSKKLREAFPRAKMTLVDIAPGMIDFVKSSANWENTDFICGDIEELDLPEKYDLIISNATFQWFSQLKNTVKKLVAGLKHEGVLAFSTFGADTFYELHEATEKAKNALKIKEKIMPGPVFHSLGQIKNIFFTPELNRERVHFSQSYYREYFPSCRDFLHTVKKIGANHSMAGQGMGVALMKKMMEIYDQDYRENNRVHATYHTIFVHYQK